MQPLADTRTLTRLDRALAYEARGFCVIPLIERGKLPPKGFLWKNGATNYTQVRSTPDEIRQWWRRWPNANIGIISGKVSGIIVLETDNPEALRSITERGLTPTYTEMSRRGPHYVYQHPGTPDGDHLNFCGIEGLECRSHGIVVAAGSTHKTGFELFVADDRPIAPPMQWVIDGLTPEPPKPPAARSYPLIDTPGDDAQRAADNLKRLAAWRCEPYQGDGENGAWLNVGMALSPLGSVGLELWDQWSQGSPKYPGYEKICDKWRTFDPNGGLQLPSLTFWANIDDPAGKRKPQGEAYTAPTPAPEPAPAPGSAALPASLPYTYRAELKNLGLQSLSAFLDCGYEATAQGLTDASERLPAAQWADVFRQTGREVNVDMIRRAGKRLGADFPPHWNAIDLSINKPNLSNRSNVGQSLDCAEKRPHRPPVLIGLPTLAQIEAGILRLSIPRIFDLVFGPDEETIEPIKAELIAALPLDLTPDEISAAVDTLTARYGALIHAQPDLTTKIETARNLYRALQRRLKDMATAPLPTGWKCRNEAEYVQTYAKGWHNAQGGHTTLSQEKLAAAIGGSPKRAKHVLNRAGVRTKSRKEYKPITSPAELRSARQWDNTIQGFAKRVVASKDGQTWHSLRLDDDKKLIPLTSPELPAMVAQAHASGLKVAIEYQQTNCQDSVSDVQPERKPRTQPEKIDRDQGVQPPPTGGNEEPKVSKPRRQYLASRRDPLVAESWLCKLLAFGTPWQRRDDSLTNRETGEITPYTVRTAFDLALGKELPMYTPVERDEPDQDLIQLEPEPQPTLETSPQGEPEPPIDFIPPPPPPSAETRAACARLELKRREDADRRLNPHLYREVMTS